MEQETLKVLEPISGGKDYNNCIKGIERKPNTEDRHCICGKKLSMWNKKDKCHTCREKAEREYMI